jgi:hypothetical protein
LDHQEQARTQIALRRPARGERDEAGALLLGRLSDMGEDALDQHRILDARDDLTDLCPLHWFW